MNVDKILFRGKDINTGRWVHGYLVRAKWYLDDRDVYLIVPEGVHVYPANEIHYHEVDPESIELYLGQED